MCITVTQKFYGCKCTIIRHVICSDHVAHTHRQIDNLPCFKTQSRFVETYLGGCEPDIKCEKMMEEKWTFDHWDANQGDFTFLEKGIDLRSKQPKCMVYGGFTKQHGCRIGKTVKGPWRHLDEKGELIKGGPIEVKNGEKGKGKDVEMEEGADVEMDAINQMKGEDVEMRQ